MTERLSKFILAVEAIFLVVPVTLLFVFWAPDEIIRPWIPAFYWSKVVAVLTGLSIVAGWWLMIAFWLRGSIALHEAHFVAWVAAAFGAFCAVAGLILLCLTDGERLQRDFGIAVFGAPLLVPLAHIIAERRRVQSSLAAT